MGKDKAILHSYPWYIADWLSSETRLNMTLLERGLYRELLDWCYREGSLPSQESTLMSIAACTSREFKRAWPVVSRSFEEREGRLHQPKVDEVLSKLDAMRAKETKAESGRAGGLAKWQQEQVAGTTRRQRLNAAKERGTHTEREWYQLLEAVRWRCVKCGSEEKLQKDHVQLVSRGGSDAIDNLQPLCKSCNAAKGPSEIDYVPDDARLAMSSSAREPLSSSSNMARRHENDRSATRERPLGDTTATQQRHLDDKNKLEIESQVESNQQKDEVCARQPSSSKRLASSSSSSSSSPSPSSETSSPQGNSSPPTPPPQSKTTPKESANGASLELGESVKPAGLQRVGTIELPSPPELKPGEFNSGAGWLEFSTAYPVQRGVDAACRWYVSEIGRQENPAEFHAGVMAGLRRYLASAAWRNRQTGDLDLDFIPGIDKFLGVPTDSRKLAGRMYLDHPPAWKPSVNLPEHSQREAAERKRKREAFERL